MPRTVWNQSRTRALIKNVTSGVTDNVQLSEMLGVKVSQIYDKRYTLGLREDNAPRQKPINKDVPARHWSDDDNANLKKMYEDGFSDEYIAEKLKRTIDAVISQRRQLRLVRSNRPNTKPQSELKFEIQEPVKAVEVRVPTTEVSLLWGLVKYTKA
jgi:hypothetical protein